MCSEEGPLTLMKGVVPRVMYLAPLAGVTLSIYDALSARIIAKKEVTELTSFPDPCISDLDVSPVFSPQIAF